MKYNPKNALARLRAAQHDDRLKASPHWMNYLIPPIARKICKAKGWDGFRLLGPAGLSCHVWVDFVSNGKAIYGILLSDPDLDTGEMKLVNMRLDTGEYKQGTIGELNGLNHPRISVSSDFDVEDVLSYGYNLTKEERFVDEADKVWAA